MEASTAGAAGSRRRNWPAILGPLLCAAGVVGYLIVVFSTSAKLAAVRDWALPNWALIAAGLALSLIGLRRGTGHVMPRLIAVTSVGLTALFAWIQRHDVARSASVLIDGEGIVRWTVVGDNFRVRPRPATILAVVDGLPDGARRPPG